MALSNVPHSMSMLLEHGASLVELAIVGVVRAVGLPMAELEMVGVVKAVGLPALWPCHIGLSPFGPSFFAFAICCFFDFKCVIE